MDLTEYIALFLAEEVLSHVLYVVISLAIGAIGSKWFFGKKYHKLLTELQSKLEELEEKLNVANCATSVQLSNELPNQTTTKPSLQEFQELSEEESCEWSTLSLQDLVSLMDQKTQLAADEYKGQWQKVEGYIEEALQSLNKTRITVRISESVIVHLNFDPTSLKGQEASIEKGKHILVEGKLDYISYTPHFSPSMFYLEECKLLKCVE